MRGTILAILLVAVCLPLSPALAGPCQESTCTTISNAYISHFTGPDCNGEEYYYTAYFSYDGVKRSWDGKGIAGSLTRTATLQSYRSSDGVCHRNAWSSGNTLSDMVRVYRDCGEASCTAVTDDYISHFTGLDCTGGEYYYTAYFGYDGVKRSWDGGGRAGTISRTATVTSYKDWNGDCHNEWTSGNTLSDLVRIYRANSGPIP